jgi:ATP-dependent RNA helicase DBP3
VLLLAGLAHTFFVGANDKPRAGELINVLREAKQTVPTELLAFGTTGGAVPLECTL